MTPITHRTHLVPGTCLILAVCALLAGCWRPVPFASVPLPRLATQLGVHTRLTDEAEPEKISRTLDMVREMGAGWIVEYFPWAYHEPSPGRPEWEHIDQVLNAAERNGLRVLARIDMVPVWARPPESSTRLLPTEHYRDYARFLGDFAARYEGRVEGVIVWNEPNVDFEWGSRDVSAAEYRDLLELSYEAVKARSPSTRVIAAGLAPTLEMSTRAVSDLHYLGQLYDLGAQRYFDALAVHSYGWTAPPEEEPAPERINFRRVELMRRIMEVNGDALKPVLVTETGWNDHPRWTKAVRPSLRVSYTLSALELARQRWPWAEAVCLWAFRLPALAHNYNDYYTLVSPGFEPRPLYEALRERANRDH